MEQGLFSSIFIPTQKVSTPPAPPPKPIEAPKL